MQVNGPYTVNHAIQKKKINDGKILINRIEYRCQFSVQQWELSTPKQIQIVKSTVYTVAPGQQPAL